MKLVFWVGILLLLFTFFLIVYPHYSCMYTITHANASLDPGVCW